MALLSLRPLSDDQVVAAGFGVEVVAGFPGEVFEFLAGDVGDEVPVVGGVADGAVLLAFEASHGNKVGTLRYFYPTRLRDPNEGVRMDATTSTVRRTAWVFQALREIDDCGAAVQEGAPIPVNAKGAAS